MWNIERKEINQLEFIKQKAIEFLKKTWELQEYKKIISVEITSNIFAIKSETWNISFYMNSKWEQLFSTLWIYKDLWKEKYNEYLKKLWYKEIKDQTWYYHMIEIKTWKEIPQESLQYYEIFEQLNLIDNKNTITNLMLSSKYLKKLVTADWNKDKNNTDTIKLGSAYKYIADILEDKDKKNNYLETVFNANSISPLEYFSYLNLWLVEKQDILKYTKQIFNLEYFQKYYKNKWFKLLEDKEFEILLWEWKANFDGERILFEKYKAYKISLKPSIENINLILEKVLPFVEKLELKNTINKQDQEKIKQRYEELREYLNTKKKELESIKNTQIHISSLKNNITDNLW